MGDDVILICNKLKVLLTYYKELQTLSKGITLDRYEFELAIRRAIERQSQLIVECATDVNNMILKSENKSPATDYFNSFLDLAESGIIELEFALAIAPSTGLRNILVHEYAKIDDSIVYHSIQKILDQYGRYIQDIAQYLDCEME